MIDLACPPLWGSWKSLLELFPLVQETVVSVIEPFVAEQWTQNQESFKNFCDLFVSYHKTAMIGSYNKQMQADFGAHFRLVNKNKNQGVDNSNVIQELSQAAMEAAVRVWHQQEFRIF